MPWGIIVLLVILLTYCTNAKLLTDQDGEDLSGHRVVRISGVTEELLSELSILDLDIWTRDFLSGDITARVNEEQYEILQLLGDTLATTVLYEDLDALIVQSMPRQPRARTMRARLPSVDDRPREDWFRDYHPYTEIQAWYKALAAKHPDIVKFVPSIGKTHQGRDIFVVHINFTPADKDKKQIWIQGLIHAREWISGAVVQYISNQLVQGRHSIPAPLRDVEYIIIPVVNPDGYAFTWTRNRLWRKNMAPALLGRGVDLNRNFAEHWGEEGSSKLPISDTYRGTSAASEPETRAIQNYFLKMGRVVGAIDWHSYSQLILFPYGWTNERISNFKDYRQLTASMAKAFGKNGRVYRPQRSIELYPTSGSATDWFVGDMVRKSNASFIPFSITVELPPGPSEGVGFLLGPENIIPVGEESWEAFVRFVDFSFKNSAPNK